MARMRTTHRHNFLGGVAAAVAACLAAGAAPAADSGGSYMVYGVGAKRCNDFVRTVIGARSRQKDEADRFVMMSWVQGYLTQYNSRSPATYSIAGRSDTQGIQLWLYNYCLAYPEDSFERAASALIDELYPARMATDPVP